MWVKSVKNELKCGLKCGWNRTAEAEEPHRRAEPSDRVKISAADRVGERSNDRRQEHVQEVVHTL